MPETPLYLDWQFWSAVVALVALALSQLPPVHIMLRKPRVRCEVYSRMYVTHSWGNPNSQWHLIVENTGGRAIRVKDINLTFSRVGGTTFGMPAQTYLPKPDSKETVLLTPFRLKPGDEWSHLVNFFAFFTREEEKKTAGIKAAIRSDIASKRKQLPEGAETACEAEPRLVGMATEFFESHFRWHPGEYQVELRVTTDNVATDLLQTYRFTLFESDSQELRSYADDYRFGAGIYFNTEVHVGVIVPIYEN